MDPKAQAFLEKQRVDDRVGGVNTRLHVYWVIDMCRKQREAQAKRR